jgi:Short C-terminal domain
MESLGLPHAKILHAEGFGRRTKTAGSFALGLSDVGHVELRTAMGGRMAYRFPPGHLTIVVGDGGRSRATIEAEEGAIAMLDSAWLAARDRRFGMLTLRHEHPDRAPAIVVLGYKHLSDGEVTERLHAALQALAARGLLSATQLRRLDPTLGPPPPATAELEPTVADLQHLVDLHTAGLLTAEEFAAAKAKLLR